MEKEARTCGHWHYYYTAIGDFLVILNSSVNFVIYIVTSRNFRQGLMLMQTAASTSARDVQQTRPTGGHSRRGVDVASTARAEYIVLARQNAAGSAATSTGEVTTAGGVVLRSTALTPIAEHSPMTAVKRLSTSPPTRYFEPKVILH